MPKAALRIDGGPDNDQRGAYVVGSFGNGAAELTVSSAHDTSVRADSVALRNSALACEFGTEYGLFILKVSVERQLQLDEERREHENARATLRCEPAGQIECVTCVLGLEHRNNDHPIAPGEPVGCPAHAATAARKRFPGE